MKEEEEEQHGHAIHSVAVSRGMIRMRESVDLDRLSKEGLTDDLSLTSF